MSSVAGALGALLLHHLSGLSLPFILDVRQPTRCAKAVGLTRQFTLSHHRHTAILELMQPRSPAVDDDKPRD